MTGSFAAFAGGLASAVLGGCVQAPSGALALPAGATASAAPFADNDGGVSLSVVRDRNYLLAFGPYALEVDPGDGGRIVQFSFDGRGVLTTRDQSEAYGSSLWPSPQSEWKWPPPIEFDKAEWKAKPQGTVLFLASSPSRELGLSADERMTADPAHGAFILEFGLTNLRDDRRRVAPWQNTRCRPRGLTFFPSQGPTLDQSAFRLEPEDGVIWFRHDPSAGRYGKVFADGSEGWIAHVDGDLLFVKTFPDVARENQAPKEADVELYVDADGKFVEVEQQGAYTDIAPRETAKWVVRWFVRRLPADVAAGPLRPRLLEIVRALVASGGA